MLPAIIFELPAQVSKPTEKRRPPLKEGTTNSEAPDEVPAEFTKALARWHPTHGSVNIQSALCTRVSCPETEPAPSLHRETGWVRCSIFPYETTVCLPAAERTLTVPRHVAARASQETRTYTLAWKARCRSRRPRLGQEHSDCHRVCR